MNVLVDTSVWSLALRRNSENLNATEKFIVAELSELVREGRARLIGLVRQELLSGIRTTEHFENLRLHLRSFPDEPIDTSDHEEAAKAGNRCRGKGIIVSIVDILNLCSSDQTRVGNLYNGSGFYKLRESASHLHPHATEVVDAASLKYVHLTT
jgi:predicted nucleic acid-binding protein